MMIETCPYCREAIEGREAIRCPSCGTPHHRVCFGENAECTVFGCESAPSDAPKIAVTSLDIPTPAPPPPLAAELKSDQTSYFVNRSGVQFGPYPLNQLQQYVAEKRIGVTDLAWSEGMPQWVFVSDVVGNLIRPVSCSATSPTASSALTPAIATPSQATETGDPLRGRICFGRGLFLLSLIGLVFVQVAFSASKDTEPLGAVLVSAGWFVTAVLRARDVGMSGWIVLLGFVPIANLFLYYRLFCAPRGYQVTKRVDTAMQVISWSLGGLVALGIVIAILSSLTR